LGHHPGAVCKETIGHYEARQSAAACLPNSYVGELARLSISAIHLRLVGRTTTNDTGRPLQHKEEREHKFGGWRGELQVWAVVIGGPGDAFWWVLHCGALVSWPADRARGISATSHFECLEASNAVFKAQSWRQHKRPNTCRDCSSSGRLLPYSSDASFIALTNTKAMRTAHQQRDTFTTR
jgi:hypothetical protein